MKGKKWRCAKKMAIVQMFVLQMLLANTITADAASNLRLQNPRIPRR